MTETTENAFVMIATRQILTADANHLDRQVRALETAVAENVGLTFDLARTIVESACKTILKDRNQAFEATWDLPRLFKETVSRLRVVPPGCEKEADAAASVRKTLGGLHTAIHGLAELRNSHGFASHGKDAYSDQLDFLQAQLVARSADILVHFLFSAHRGYRPANDIGRLTYSEMADFNAYIDELQEPVKILHLEYPPSEVLFRVDADAYRDLFVAFTELSNALNCQEALEGGGEAVPPVATAVESAPANATGEDVTDASASDEQGPW